MAWRFRLLFAISLLLMLLALNLEVNTWRPMFGEPLPSSEKVTNVKLKLFSAACRYAHLGSKLDFSVVSPSKLDALQGGKSHDLLNEYKSVIGWNIGKKKRMK